MLSLSKIISTIINRMEQLVIITIAPKTVDKDIFNLLDFEAHLTDLESISANDVAPSVATIEFMHLFRCTAIPLIPICFFKKKHIIP